MPVCRVCAAQSALAQVVTERPTGREMNVVVCGNCGYVEMPDNTHDYNEIESTDDMALSNRCGTLDRTGREFGMAQLGVDVLHRSDLAVMMYGVGRSLDNIHVGRLPEVRRVVIGDIIRIRDDAEFVDVSLPATERFDVVVASEVIEHFIDAHAEFEKLFGYIEDNGVLICSTNINDGGGLARQRYIFAQGHVSYYSPQSLRHIAKANGMQVDFRAPIAATGKIGPRKRYVIFTRSGDVMDSVSDYFGSHLYAPSEPPNPVGPRKPRRPK